MAFFLNVSGPQISANERLCATMFRRAFCQWSRDVSNAFSLAYLQCSLGPFWEKFWRPSSQAMFGRFVLGEGSCDNIGKRASGGLATCFAFFFILSFCPRTGPTLPASVGCPLPLLAPTVVLMSMRKESGLA